MIRHFLSFSSSQVFFSKIESSSASQKILSIRFFSDSNSGRSCGKPFFFSEEEARRGPSVGSVQSHLPWVSEETEVKKDQSYQFSSDQNQTSDEKKKERYAKILKSLEDLSKDSIIERKDRIVLREISNRVNKEYIRFRSISVSH